MTSNVENILVILAAGRGTRLNSPNIRHKSLTPFNGLPLLERVIGQFRACGLDKALVVTGHESELVAEHARNALPAISIVHNDLYEVDKNIYSLFLALASLEPGFGAIIVEGDVIITDEAVEKFAKLCESSEFNLWATTGFFQKWQKGAIVNADPQGKVEEIKYSSWSEDLAGWYRDLGLRFLRPEYVELYLELLRKYILVSMDEYFWTPWQDNLNLLPTINVDLGFDGGGTFNTLRELEKIRKRFGS